MNDFYKRTVKKYWFELGMVGLTFAFVLLGKQEEAIYTVLTLIAVGIVEKIYDKISK